MAAIIGTLDILMRADTGPLKKDLKSGTAELSTFSKGLSSIGASLGGLGAGIGIGAVVAGMVSLTKSSLGAMDTLNDLAVRVGSSTAEIDKLSYAIKISGGEVESLSPSLNKLGINLVGAVREAGPAREALASIGLEAGSLLRLDPTEAFKQIASGIAGIENPAQQAQVALALMGKGAVGLLGVLKGGGQEIDNLGKELVKLRGGFIDPKDFQAVAAAGDEMDRLGQIVTGVGNSMAAAISPAIVEIGHTLEELDSEVLHTGSAARVVVTALAEGIEVVALAVRGLVVLFKAASALFTGIATVGAKVWAGITGDESAKAFADEMAENSRKQTEAVGASAVKLGNDWARTGAGADAASSGMKDLAAGAIDLAGDVSTLTDSLNEQIATFGMSKSQIELFKLTQQGASAEVLKSVTALTEQRDALDANKKATDELTASAKAVHEATSTSGEKEAERYEKLQQMLEHGLISNQEFDRSKMFEGGDFGAKLKAALDESKTDLDKIDEKMRDLSKLRLLGGLDADQFAKAAKTAVASIIDGARTPLEVLQKKLDYIAGLKQRGLLSPAEAVKAQRHEVADITQAGKSPLDLTRERLESIEKRGSAAGLGKDEIGKALKAEASSLIESVKSPLDRFKEQMSTFQLLRDKGAITDVQQANLARGAFKGEFAQTDHPFAGAATRGSTEAYSSILSALGVNKDKGLDAVAKNTGDANRILSTIAANTTRKEQALAKRERF